MSDEIVKLVIGMLDAHNHYGDKIGFTRKDIKRIYDEYDVLDSIDINRYSDFYELYENEFISKKKLIKTYRDMFGDSDLDDPVEFVEFLESKSLINYFIDLMIPSEIKEREGKWYFYAPDGWKYFADYFYIPADYRKDAVEVILAGEGMEIFWYDCNAFKIKDSYLDVNEENLKYLKSILQNMKEDFEIEQEEIDNIKDLDDVVEVIREHDIDDFEKGLDSTYCNSQGYADEDEAYNSLINDVMEHFGFDKATKWVKGSEKSEYDDTLEIQFKDESAAKDAIIMLYKIDNSIWDDTSEFQIKYDPPYYGYQADNEKVEDYFNQELQERLPDYIDKYIP